MIYYLSIPFQCIYMLINGHLAQHQERSCKCDLSNTFTLMALFFLYFLYLSWIYIYMD